MVDVSNNALRLWWMKKPRPGNFGDVLTIKLFHHFQIPFVYDKINIEAISIGSIANRANKDTLVLGSGIMSRYENLNSQADWKFVRGPLTRKRVIECGGDCPEIYGDPALLLPLFCEESEKEYTIGITPHLFDYEYVKENYSKYKIIDLVNIDPLSVAKEITKCDAIISSSLHGIIAAHAYGIPAAWVKFSDKLEGDDSKFHDYYASINLEAKLSTIDNPIFSCSNLNLDPIIKIFTDLKNKYKDAV